MRKILAVLGLATLIVPACAAEEAPDGRDGAPLEYGEGTGEISQRAVDCTTRSDTGYKSGQAFPITVVTVDGKPVEIATANAFYVMQQAAAKQGVSIKISSGFRTMAEQQYLYNCYLNKNCNNGNLAAKPGYSNHQSGHALDLNTSSSGVLTWLNANGSAFGFKRTVPSETWHWEWWGGGPGGGICGVCQPHCEGAVMVASDCSKGNCGAFGASCVNDGLGLRCVAPGCQPTGNSEFCLDDARIGSCHDGSLGVGDCSKFAAKCEKDGAGAKCSSVLCPKTGESSGCLDSAKLLTCKAGAPSIGDCSVFGAACTEELGPPRCIAPYAATLLATSSSAEADETKAAAYKVCAGSLVTTRFELKNDGYLTWVDTGGTGKAEYGQAMRLGTRDGTKLDFKDPFTESSRASIKNNSNNKVVWNGPDCADKPGCRRTVFEVTGAAPSTAGIYKTSWKLLDESKYTLDAPLLATTYRVYPCELPTTETNPEETNEGGAAGAAGANANPNEGGAAGAPDLPGSGGSEASGPGGTSGAAGAGQGGSEAGSGEGGGYALAIAGAGGGSSRGTPREGTTEESSGCSVSVSASVVARSRNGSRLLLVVFFALGGSLRRTRRGRRSGAA
jgi:hypothetical protein